MIKKKLQLDNEKENVRFVTNVKKIIKKCIICLTMLMNCN